jgi:hypothetical protein
VTIDVLISDDPDMDSDRAATPQSHSLDFDMRVDEELHLDPLAAVSAPPLP